MNCVAQCNSSGAHFGATIVQGQIDMSNEVCWWIVPVLDQIQTGDKSLC